MKRPFILLTLIAIFALGTFLRVIHLDTTPIELFGDEVDAGYQGYSLLTTGRDYKGNFLPIYAESFSEWRAPLLMYTMVPFIKIFGLNAWGVRLTAAFWGIVSLVGFYLLLKELNVADEILLVSSLLLAISPWHIQYSRAGFELTLLSSLVLFGSLTLIRALKSQSIRYSVVSAILFGLTFYTYSTANVFVPLLVLGIIVLFRRGKILKPETVKLLLPMFVLIILIVSPLIASVVFGHAADRFQKFSVFNDQTILDQINQYRSTIGENKFLGIIFQNKPVFWAKKIVSNYFGAFSPDFLFGHGDVTFRQSLHEVGGFFWTEAVLIVIGILAVLRRKKLETVNKVMGFWLLISPVASSLTVDGATHASRLFYLIFPLVYFSSVGIFTLLQLARENRKGLAALFYRGFLVFMSVCLVFEFANFQHYYWVHYRIESWRWWQYGYKEAMASIQTLTFNNQYRMVIIENTYEPSYIRYLFWMKVDPRTIFGVSDSMKPNTVGGLTGFCLPGHNTCFVDFQGKPPQDVMKKGTLYMISQDKNLPGDWDWGKTPPANVKVLKTIRNPYGYPIFYLVTSA